jgi:hypothetical protein
MAQGVADGLCLKQAGIAAGYSRNSTSCIYKVARDPAFRARVETLIRQRQWGASDGLAPMIELMVDCAQSARELGNGAGMTAAHRLLAEAARLKQLLPPPLAPGELSDEDWRRAYGPRS